jgi:hypothetical protein
MSYAIAEIIGTGEVTETIENPYRADVDNSGILNTIIPSNQDGTPKFSWCLVELEDYQNATGPNLVKIPAQNLDKTVGDLSGAKKLEIQNKLTALGIDTSWITNSSSVKEIIKKIANHLDLNWKKLRITHDPAEVISKRTSKSKTYDLGRGKYELKIGGDIIHYKNDNDDWEDVDLELPVPVDGIYKLTKNISRIDIDSNRGKFRIYPYRNDDTKYIDMGSVTDINVNVTKISKNLIEISKDTTNVNYKFYVSDKGLKIHYELKNSNAPLTYDFLLKLTGLTRQGRNIMDGAKQLFSLPDPILIDSNDEPIDNSCTEIINGNIATITCDLQGNSYPVILDPSVTITASATDDFYVDGAYPDTAMGQHATYKDRLQVHQGTGSNPHRPVLKIDYSAIPNGAIIGNATLSLYPYQNGGAQSPAHTYWCNRCTETGITDFGTWNDYDGTNPWASAGGDFTTTDRVSALVTSAGTRIEWYPTEIVRYGYENTSKIGYFLIHDGDESGGGQYMNYRSGNYATASERPTLTITYTTEPNVQIFDSFTEPGTSSWIALEGHAIEYNNTGENLKWKNQNANHLIRADVDEVWTNLGIIEPQNISKSDESSYKQKNLTQGINAKTGVTGTSVHVGVCARRAVGAQKNFYIAAIRGNGTVLFGKYVNNSFFSISTPSISGFSAATYYDLKYVINDNTHDVYIDGELLVDGASDSAHPDENEFGMTLRATQTRTGEYFAAWSSAVKVNMIRQMKLKGVAQCL